MLPINTSKTTPILGLLVSLMAMAGFSAASVHAQITNPAIGSLGTTGGAADSGPAAALVFATFFVRIWRAAVTLGGLIVIVFFLWGAFDWITAGGDASKISSARNKIVQSVLGLLILVGSFVILDFISGLFFGDSFQILQLNFLGQGATPASTPSSLPVPGP
ncbi:MAG: hypothetical protein COU69_00665 [Candidatus Pacebacteria bacterium CG10_big_fil_rev_8_21_14_0_10_56_10]|nr:MAG: hypothetical protein COU69_00665 [Candidatus Pacebacteria bacterium CG10_big_fil_rev_8_21_14_0_10_56_10]